MFVQCQTGQAHRVQMDVARHFLPPGVVFYHHRREASLKQMADSLTKMNSKINDEIDRINTFQQNLLTQLAQSDAAITQLENQATYFQNLFNTNNKNNN